MTIAMVRDGGCRVERILDTTSELMLRWGAKRVTVGEIARRSCVGKGTVYLHWETKDDLIHDAVARECATVVEEAVAAVERCPEDARLSRLARVLFLVAMQHPLTRALNIRDADVLGDLTHSTTHGLLDLRLSALLSEHRYLQLLAGHQLLRPLPAMGTLEHAVAAVVEGFLVPLPGGRPGVLRPVQVSAHQLEQVMQAAFEPLDGLPRLISGQAAGMVLDHLLAVRQQCARRAVHVDA